MLHELLVRATNYIVPFTEMLGVAVVSWGVLHGLGMLAQRTWLTFTNPQARETLGDIRIAIVEKMALGLDLFLAGDIVGTIVVPSREALLMVGGIVVIRTVMSYFLGKEIEKKAAG